MSVTNCELCAASIGDPHRHVVELRLRRGRCTCCACARRFARDDVRAAYRTVPNRVLVDLDFAMTCTEWANLGARASLAFVIKSRGTIGVCYPGHAGQLDPHAWTALSAATPLAPLLAEDVEALMIHNNHGALACYLVPITTAWALVRASSCAG